MGVKPKEWLDAIGCGGKKYKASYGNNSKSSGKWRLPLAA